ncbi:hypothetical protein JB92DRAFT_2830735 [Gautieria morchelliformis]|nr:hypothetical protein JB92DRAFT_2830735 [Gautieria morchelliformis]
MQLRKTDPYKRKRGHRAIFNVRASPACESEYSSNEVTPVFPQYMAFAPSRLKDLIKKYQQSHLGTWTLSFLISLHLQELNRLFQETLQPPVLRQRRLRPLPVSFRRHKPAPPLDETASEETLSMPTPAPEHAKEAQHSAKIPLPEGIPRQNMTCVQQGSWGEIATSLAALWASMTQDGDGGDQFNPPANQSPGRLLQPPGS